MIDIQKLSVKYGEFTAIKDLNITISDGEFFTFLGPSGCGKTTTLRTIAGFETPASGKITAYGKDLSGLLPEERNLGFVFQNYALFPSMNVYDNIAFGLKMHKTGKSLVDAKVRSIAQKVGIEKHLHKKISELSGGQQQRIAVARALVLEPRILLMDEPLSNLDAKLRISMREEIKRLQKDLRITTLYVTHDQEEALAISDRIAVFNNGCVEQVGTSLEIYNQPKTEFVARFIGDINSLTGKLLEQAQVFTGASATSSLYVRPQKLRFCSEDTRADGELALPAVVTGFEFFGTYAKVEAQMADSEKLIGLIFDPASFFAVGSRVEIHIPKQHILHFGKETV